MEIRGHCDERFSAVRDAFEANFLADEEEENPAPMPPMGGGGMPGMM
jgi:hypothetical protein